jgi:hypothetical protein
MPGARWFPGAQVNYAREVLRHADAAHAAGMPAIVSDNELGEVRELSWPELRRQVAAWRSRSSRSACSAATAWPPTCPTCPRPWSRSWRAEHRRVWSVCAPDMGTGRRGRPLPPDRAQGADRRRRRALRRQAARPQRGAARTARPAAEREEAAAGEDNRLPQARVRTMSTGRGHRARRRRGRRVRARVAALRPSDLDRLFERHHRPAQAHRARAGRHHPHHARLRPAQRRRRELRRQQLRRALPLVQLHRLGDVELADLGPGLRRHHLHLRRQPGGQQGKARLDACCGASSRGTGSPSSAPARPTSPTA